MGLTLRMVDDMIEKIHEGFPEHDILMYGDAIWHKPRGWRERVDIDNWKSGNWSDESTDTCG